MLIRPLDPGCKKNPGSGIPGYIPDLIFENLVSVFWVKILKLFDADPDPESGILLTLDPGSGMEKSDPGSGINTRIRNTV
jgi:hypothetical protein